MSKSRNQHHPLTKDGKRRKFARLGRKHKPYGLKDSGKYGGEVYFGGQSGRYGRKEYHGEEICDVINKKAERRKNKIDILDIEE